MIDISKIKLSNGKDLIELLKYNGESYWWSIDKEVNNSFRLGKNIRCNISDKLQLFISNNLPHLILMYDLLTKYVYKQIINKDKFQIKDTNLPSMAVHIYQSRWIKKRDGLTNKIKIRNIFYEDIFEKISDKISIRPIYDYTYNPTALIFYKKYVTNYSSLSYPMSNNWSMKIHRQCIKAVKHFNNIYSEIKNDKLWLSKIELESKLPESKILEILKYQILFVIPFGVKYNLLLDDIFKHNNYDLAFLVSEQTPQGREWIKISKQNKVRSIALQHGLMSKHDIVYNQNVIIPELMLVWSKYEAHILVDDVDYPVDRVIVTGNPRYDRLFIADKLYSKDDFIQKHGLCKNNKFILWAIEFIGNTYDETIDYINEVFSSICDISDVTIIIKPHPANNDVDYNLLYKMIHKYNISALVMPKDSDTTELIYISDIIIIKTSTIGDEAIIFHKPLIELNIDKTILSANYSNEQAAILVSKRGELRQSIENILINKSDITRKAQDDFVEHHNYNGMASERVAKLLLGLLIK